MAKARTDDYCRVITQQSCQYVEQIVIRSKNYSLATVLERRQMLSPMVDKRYLYPCMIHTDPLGSQVTVNWNGNGLCPYRCKLPTL